jgi:hypothetical protein
MKSRDHLGMKQYEAQRDAMRKATSPVDGKPRHRRRAWWDIFRRS